MHLEQPFVLCFLAREGPEDSAPDRTFRVEGVEQEAVDVSVGMHAIRSGLSRDLITDQIRI